MSKPNILLVICDDLGVQDLPCYGNPHTHTPTLSQLSLEGCRLLRHYSGPLCTPARAELMTGRCAYRTRAIDTYLGRSMIEPSERTLPQILSEAGYATGLFGKWHLGDCYPMRPHDMGFQEAVYHTGGGLQQPANVGRRSYFSPDLMRNGCRITTQGYCTDVFTDHALGWMNEHLERQPKQPFFAYVAFNAPHDPLEIGQAWTERYRKLNLPEEVARLYGMVENIDYNVGRMLYFLKERDLDQNTIVVFTSDHGPGMPVRYNGQLRGRKCTLFEGGLRVPGLVRWPGRIAAGVTCDQITAPIDWLPTLADWCGAKLPGDRLIDGWNIGPSLRTQASPEQVDRHKQRRLVFQWHRGDRPEPRRNAAVITHRFKVIWHQRQSPMLFDLSADPGETTDLGASELAVGRELIEVYDRWFAEVSQERGAATFDPPRIVLGSAQEPQTHLTWQDWRLYVPTPEEWWRAEMPGYWLVHVARKGKYRLSMELPPINVPTHLHVRCGKLHVKCPVLPRDQSLGFDALELSAGEARLEVYLGEDQPELGPVSVCVEGPL